MKHFIHDVTSIVTDAVEAEVLLSGWRVRRLDGFPEIKVVVRADWNRESSGDRARVAIVSGGGSGHEPAHAGFVGDGMLTAAVCGGVFASPSVDAVLAAIVAVTGQAGCLLVVKNYTGDRLNFGLAAERARALGLAVEMVVVADDIALPDAPHPRGVAGTLFVHKVAGHLARAGGSLAEVKAAAEKVARGSASLGVALSSCNIPGQTSENRIGPSQVELGLGIHGEPGARLVAFGSVRDLAVEMVALVEGALDARGITGGPVALLINDLGGVSPIEMAIAAGAVARSMKRYEPRLVFGPERLMTSLDMKGFSVSVLPLSDADPSLEAALLSPVGPRAWPPGRRPEAAAPLPLPEQVRAKLRPASTHAARRQVLERICDALVAKQGELDALDAKVGDGDTGTTLAGAARAVRAELDRLPFASPSDLCAAISDILARGVGGSSGILLAIFSAATGAAFSSERTSWPAALVEGQLRLQEYGGAKPGDRTMLDALAPALAALAETGDLADAARAASEGAARTASMTKARAGRSSYVREDALLGVPDPGAVAASAVFEALAAT